MIPTPVPGAWGDQGRSQVRPTRPGRRPRRGELFAGAGLAVLTLLVYARTAHFPFINYDDPAYVTENAHVGAGLTAESVRWAFTSFACGYWQPVTWLSLQLDCEFSGGIHPGGFHLTNVLLHTANALLLFLVLARLTGAPWRSAVVAALFALHPLHVESVAWVTERKDVLSTLFWMLTLAAYAWYVRRPGVARYLPVVLALGLGLLAKPMLVTLPCVLLLLDYWPLRRWRPGPGRDPGAARAPELPPAVSLGRLLLEKLPLFALALASCVVTYRAQFGAQAVAPLEAFPLGARLGNAALAYVSYLGKTFWPVRLALYYPHPGAEVSVPGAVGAGLLLVAVTVLVLGPGRHRPYLAVGWLWYLGTLVPVIGLVQAGGQAMADRFTYVPLIGVFVLLTWGAADLATAWRLPRALLATAAAAVVCACGALSWVQVGYWQSSLTLWEHAAAVTDKNVLAHINLGTCYYERRRISDAKREFEKAVAIDPRIAQPHVNLGNIFAELDLPQRAASEYRQAIDLAPNLAWAHASLGKLLGDLGRLGEAAAEYRTAIALAPGDAALRNDLGILLLELGRWHEALAEFSRAVDLDPGKAEPHANLGQVLQEEGRLEEALAAYRRAVALGDKQARPRLQACERLRALRPRLAALIAGQDRPADSAERLTFADLCRQPGPRRYALAASLYADAFRADPRLADDLGAANRRHAAAAAAAAGCGRGRDGAGLDEPRRARLRRQAMNWLRAELALWDRQLSRSAPRVRAAVQQALRLWQHDPCLAGVRDPGALAKLPEAECATWQELWQGVEALLARARAPQRKP
jgi:tetratricopeptide (TPR) repeat protein